MYINMLIIKEKTETTKKEGEELDKNEAELLQPLEVLEEPAAMDKHKDKELGKAKNKAGVNIKHGKPLSRLTGI